jgi:hypothetical protein
VVRGERFFTPHTLLAGVIPEWVWLLPSWLLVGLAAGTALSVVIAGVFVVGNHLFPSVPVDPSARVDGTDRRRTEIREYLRAIGEPFAESHRVEGEEVAFYLLHRHVAITFDAQAYFRLESRGVASVLCEEEMPGSHLGRRLPFEVPEVDFGTDDTGDSIAAAYGRLGLPTGASEAEVKAAYRSQVKSVHPDQGGDEESFKRLREAYVTAKDHAAT